jgi:putative membrane protein
MGGWGYVLMTLSMLLFWGLIIGAVVALVRYFGGAGRAVQVTPTTPNGPERILAERFARGEIDEDEYRRRIAVVRHPAAP